MSDASSPTCLVYFKDLEVKGPLISSLQILQNREIQCTSSQRVRRYVILLEKSCHSFMFGVSK